MNKDITICGNLGSGKSTVAKLLKASLQLPIFSVGDIMREIAMSRKMDINQFLNFLKIIQK